jgi:TfoX/Sxy family transcriptional regulator of competence genes
MQGKIPSAHPSTVATFERLVPTRPNVAVKKVFGQPAAFVNGNMFMGVFGSQVFIRLSEEEGRSALERPGIRAFEPMAGRPMRGYVVLPEAILRSPSAAQDWVARSLAYSEGLPPKTAKRKSR